MATTEAPPTARLFEPPPDSHGDSLEDLILRAWDELVATASADCPVCGARMRVATGCQDCGSQLG